MRRCRLRPDGRLMFARMVVGFVVAALVASGATHADRLSERASAADSPQALSAGSSVTRHFEYVFVAGGVDVYDIDAANRLVTHFALPNLGQPRGVSAYIASGMLYLAYGGQGAYGGTGSMLAYNLSTGRVVWLRHYQTGVDRMAITSDGRTIYLPDGEDSPDGVWELVDAATGNVTGSVTAGGGAHDTVMGSNGRSVYLGEVDTPYLDVVSTLTNTLVRQIGPLISGGRPFVINRAQTLAFTTAESFVGFQVSSVTTGNVLYTVGVPGFPFNAADDLGNSVVCHGIVLAPDEQRLYVVDTDHGYVHAFDVSGLPARRPRLLASVKLDHVPPGNVWLQRSWNGRYLYVGGSGDVIDTRSLTVVGYLPSFRTTSLSLEIDWQSGRPVGMTG